MLNPIRTAFVPGRERVRRVDYLIAWVVSTAILVLAAILTTIVLSVVLAAGSSSTERADMLLQGLLPWITGIVILPASMYSGTVMGIRRLHDMNRSGRWMIAYYLTYGAALATNVLTVLTASGFVSALSNVLTVGFGIGFLALMLLPGSRDQNRYGPVPRS